MEVRRREQYLPARQLKTGLSFKERKEYEQLLARIEALEKEQKSLESFFQEPSADPVELERNSRRYREIQGTLEAQLARWEEAGRASRGLSASASPLRHAPFEVSVSRSGNASSGFRPSLGYMRAVRPGLECPSSTATALTLLPLLI